MKLGVVVGYDRTPAGEAALAEAAAEAVRRRLALTVVYASHAPHHAPHGVDRADAEQAAERVQAHHPGLPVHSRALTGSLPTVFTTLSPDADLLVLAHHQHGTLAPLAFRTVTRSACPTVVIRGGVHRPRGLVLAAVDVGAVDSPDSPDAALDFAFAEAAFRGERLKAVSALEVLWHRIYAAGAGRLGSASSQALERAATKTEQLLQRWRTKHPDVPADHELYEGAPTVILTAATTCADLMVISAPRRKTGHPGMRIGPLAHTLLLHSDCPVAFVPAD